MNTVGRHEPTAITPWHAGAPRPPREQAKHSSRENTRAGKTLEQTQYTRAGTQGTRAGKTLEQAGKTLEQAGKALAQAGKTVAWPSRGPAEGLCLVLTCVCEWKLAADTATLEAVTEAAPLPPAGGQRGLSLTTQSSARLAYGSPYTKHKGKGLGGHSLIVEGCAMTLSRCVLVAVLQHSWSLRPLVEFRCSTLLVTQRTAFTPAKSPHRPPQRPPAGRGAGR